MRIFDRVSCYSRALLACFARLPTYQGLRISYLRVLHDKMDGRGSQRKKNLELNSGLRKWEGRWIRLWPGLRSWWILSNSGSDSGSDLKLSNPTPTPTPLRLRLYRMYSMLRRAIWCSYFLDFIFDCIRTDDTPIYSPFAPTADAVGRDTANSFECGRHASLWMHWHSYKRSRWS